LFSCKYNCFYVRLSVTQDQDEECLKAEKLLKSLLLIDTSEKDESDVNSEVEPGSVQDDEASQRSIPSEPSEEHLESNSNDSTANPANSEAKPKRRRRRRPRKRKGKTPIWFYGFGWLVNFGML
jgi:hypothetical protein